MGGTRVGVENPVFKAISHDDGLSWEGVYPTLMSCGHRPVAGLTKSGKVLITFAELLNYASPGRRNTRALLKTQESALETDRDKQSGIALPLDHGSGVFGGLGNGYIVCFENAHSFLVNLSQE